MEIKISGGSINEDRPTGVDLRAVRRLLLRADEVDRGDRQLGGAGKVEPAADLELQPRREDHPDRGSDAEQREIFEPAVDKRRRRARSAARLRADDLVADKPSTDDGDLSRALGDPDAAADRHTDLDSSLRRVERDELVHLDAVEPDVVRGEVAASLDAVTLEAQPADLADHDAAPVQLLAHIEDAGVAAQGAPSRDADLDVPALDSADAAGIEDDFHRVRCLPLRETAGEAPMSLLARVLLGLSKTRPGQRNGQGKRES